MTDVAFVIAAYAVTALALMAYLGSLRARRRSAARRADSLRGLAFPVAPRSDHQPGRDGDGTIAGQES